MYGTLILSNRAVVQEVRTYVRCMLQYIRLPYVRSNSHFTLMDDDGKVPVERYSMHMPTQINAETPQVQVVSITTSVRRPEKTTTIVHLENAGGPATRRDVLQRRRRCSKTTEPAPPPLLVADFGTFLSRRILCAADIICSNTTHSNTNITVPTPTQQVLATTPPLSWSSSSPIHFQQHRRNTTPRARNDDNRGYQQCFWERHDSDCSHPSRRGSSVGTRTTTTTTTAQHVVG